MSVDRQLQERVLAALEHEPGVEVAGFVPTFRQKWLAERAARLASGRRVCQRSAGG